jgi:hypothetical protein
MASIVIALEIGRRGLATQITVDALVVDVEFSIDVLGVFIRNISHN